MAKSKKEVAAAEAVSSLLPVLSLDAATHTLASERICVDSLRVALDSEPRMPCMLSSRRLRSAAAEDGSLNQKDSLWYNVGSGRQCFHSSLSPLLSCPAAADRPAVAKHPPDLHGLIVLPCRMWS